MKSNSKPKDRILETASRLFYTQGYNATGINQILEEAKVAKASLYKHYGSKDDLGVAYVMASRENWFNALNAFIANKKQPIEKLLACFDFLERNLVQNDFKGCRFINLLAEVSEQNATMRKEIVGHKTNIRMYFNRLVNDILKDKDKASHISDTIFILFEGAVVESKIHLDIWPVITAKKTVSILMNAKT